MAITVLKNNVPWGPFTREQIDDGLTRGDFTLRYLAHAPGLKEWHPLGEVLDYVERNAGPRPPALAPLPPARELPPVPEEAKPKPPPINTGAMSPPAFPPTIPVSTAPAPVPVAQAIELRPASFFRRGFAFLIDGAILFTPLGILWVIGALSIVIPGIWNHLSQQARADEWDLLRLNTWRLFWVVTIGFGWLYGAGLEASTAQGTLGKRWMGLKVTDDGGERVSFLRSTGRYAAKYLSALPCFLGFIMALFSARGLTLHDRVSDTRVVKR